MGMLGPRHEIAWLQSDFYQEAFRRTLRWLMASVCIMFLLIGAIVYYAWYRPPMHYYANTTDGRIIEMPQPN